MYGFIVFGFKIIFAAIAGGSLYYVPGKESKQHKIIETSLICIFGAAILGLSRQLSSGESNFAMGFGILTVVMAIIYISQNMEFRHRIIWYFAAVSGMIIGSGYIFQAGTLIALIYIIFIHKKIEIIIF